MSLHTSLQHAHACADQLVNAVVDAHKEAVTSNPFAELMLLDLIAQARATMSKLNAMVGACPDDLHNLLSVEQQADMIKGFQMLGDPGSRRFDRDIYDAIEDMKAKFDMADVCTGELAEMCTNEALRGLLNLADGMWTTSEMITALGRLKN